DRPLAGEETAAVKMLRDAASASGARANIKVLTVDITPGVPKELQPLWESAKERTLPCILLRFPEAVRLDRAIWSGALTVANARKLLDSPVRRRIAERIIAGDAAVWVLLESGNRTLDDAAADSLKAAFSALKENILPIRNLSYRDDSGKAPSYSFSVVRLSRGNAAEPLLETVLMRLEPDLEEYTRYPMAIPVFGRGRALYALVGKGINNRTIVESCLFMVEGCSCEVKALNPGLDLLMTADWEHGIGESWIPVEDTPPLTGLPVVPAASGKADTLMTGSRTAALSDSAAVVAAAPVANTGGPSPAIAANDTMLTAGLGSPSPLGRNIAIAFILVVAIALTLVFRLGVSGKKS
ncbi:MAG: hypothetical protein ACYC9O_14925, partial [Candidatus Latescibacterota bacterium]